MFSKEIAHEYRDGRRDQALDGASEVGFGSGHIQGKTTVSESSRQFDLPPSEIESWIHQAKAGMENALKAKPEDIREQYETQLKALQEAYGEAMLELRARKNGKPCWRRGTRHDPSSPAGHEGRRI
jgi:flagellar biosynthesis/type III secretory pathway protein FliH